MVRHVQNLRASLFGGASEQPLPHHVLLYGDKESEGGMESSVCGQPTALTFRLHLRVCNNGEFHVFCFRQPLNTIYKCVLQFGHPSCDVTVTAQVLAASLCSIFLLVDFNLEFSRNSCKY